MTAAVFLDRDNTIIHNDEDLGDPSQVRFIQGAASAIASLKGLGYRIIVVTNQGGVARGKYGEADVDRVNERINELIRANSSVVIDRFYYCPYHPEGTVDRYRRDHPWRKPRPGMLLQAARDLGLDLRQSWMIGDQLRDVQAGFAAGAIPILLATDGSTPAPFAAAPPGAPEERPGVSKTVMIAPSRDFFVVRSLTEAVRLVGQKSRPTNVTAAMKTDRVEVVPKPQSRVATASFDVPGVPGVPGEAGEAEEKAAVLAVVNETATEQAAEASVAASASASGSRRGRSEPRHESKQASKSSTIESALAKVVEVEDEVKPEPVANAVAEPKRTESKAPAVHRAPAQKPTRVPPGKRRADGESHDSAAVEADASRSSASIADVGVEPGKPVDVAKSVSPSAPTPPPEPTVTASTTPASADPAPAPASASGAPLTAEQTLRQILQELRSQRKVVGEFNYVGVMAIILQMVAVVCMLAALLMGAGNNDIFTRWIACAIIVQLATVAMLLFRK